ncbi:MAG: DUF3179 domain-containing protein, partial [Candidatus Omnitrophica bacterium]|nr:DUF3179 domain-containing protein [Candidatus Omnitrophota bacterium]
TSKELDLPDLIAGVNVTDSGFFNIRKMDNGKVWIDLGVDILQEKSILRALVLKALLFYFSVVMDKKGVKAITGDNVIKLIHGFIQFIAENEEKVTTSDEKLQQMINDLQKFFQFTRDMDLSTYNQNEYAGFNQNQELFDDDGQLSEKAAEHLDDGDVSAFESKYGWQNNGDLHDLIGRLMARFELMFEYDPLGEEPRSMISDDGDQQQSQDRESSRKQHLVNVVVQSAVQLFRSKLIKAVKDRFGPKTEEDSGTAKRAPPLEEDLQKDFVFKLQDLPLEIPQKKSIIDLRKVGLNFFAIISKAFPALFVDKIQDALWLDKNDTRLKQYFTDGEEYVEVPLTMGDGRVERIAVAVPMLRNHEIIHVNYQGKKFIITYSPFSSSVAVFENNNDLRLRKTPYIYDTNALYLIDGEYFINDDNSPKLVSQAYTQIVTGSQRGEDLKTLDYAVLTREELREDTRVLIPREIAEKLKETPAIYHDNIYLEYENNAEILNGLVGHDFAARLLGLEEEHRFDRSTGIILGSGQRQSEIALTEDALIELVNMDKPSVQVDFIDIKGR